MLVIVISVTDSTHVFSSKTMATPMWRTSEIMGFETQIEDPHAKGEVGFEEITNF